MIWDRGESDRQENSAIVSHIVSEIGAVCAERIAVGAINAVDIAHAVETFLQREGGADFVDSKYLTMLASNALSAIGENGAAQRLFLFGTGLVAPSEWDVIAGEEMWVVDLKHMAVRDDAAIELLLFRSLNVVIESVADVWDSVSGTGILGLKHVCATASVLLGGVHNKTRLETLTNEIVTASVRKLEQVAAARSWRSVPRVMNLDF